MGLRRMPAFFLEKPTLEFNLQATFNRKELSAEYHTCLILDKGQEQVAVKRTQFQWPFPFPIPSIFNNLSFKHDAFFLQNSFFV